MKIRTISIEELPNGCHVYTENGLSIYSLVPPEARQGWSLELIETNQATSLSLKKAQTYLLLVTEGALTIECNGKRVLEAGEAFKISSGTPHQLTFSQKPCRFIRVFFSSNPVDQPPLFDVQYSCGVYTKADYTAYEIITGIATSEAWSLALLEIKDVPLHYHQQGTETFIVLQGELDIVIDNKLYHLKSQELALIPHLSHHRLRSAYIRKPVYVLCLNFPAFDPQDFHPL